MKREIIVGREIKAIIRNRMSNNKHRIKNINNNIKIRRLLCVDCGFGCTQPISLI